MEWFELTKARRVEQGLGHTTFSDCIKRLLDKQKIRSYEIAKNVFYQAVFVPGNLLGIGSSLGADLLKSDVALDMAARAFEHLSNKKPLGGV
jgi:hypothetical protein